MRGIYFSCGGVHGAHSEEKVEVAKGSTSRAYSPAVTGEMRNWIEAALTQRPRGLLTDIDGTLSPIAPTPDQARLLRGVRPTLRRALDSFDLVAAISGRPAVDARRMVGIPQMTYIGNHGMERLTPLDRVPQISPEVRAYQDAIADTLHEARVQLKDFASELLFENKGATASIHYRLASDADSARLAILSALEPLAHRQRLRVTEGRMVVEIRPPLDRDKGTSVRALIREYGLACAVYLGDDTTDLDAFRALRALREDGVCQAIAVAVRHSEAPAALLDTADIALDSLDDVPRFLRWLLLLAAH